MNNKLINILSILVLFFMSTTSFAASYFDIGPSYSVVNTIRYKNIETKSQVKEVTLENGDLDSYTDEKYGDYSFIKGDRKEAVHPSFGLQGRFGINTSDNQTTEGISMMGTIGLYSYLGYENNLKDWKSYKLDFGAEAGIDFGVIAIGLRAVFLYRIFSCDNYTVDRYVVDDSAKEITPVYEDTENAFSFGFGMGFSVYSPKLTFVNSRLFADFSFGFWPNYESTYDSGVIETAVKFGVLYSIM